MADALVSVVIPAFNSAGWIAETLASILAQEYANLEIIVVDDGSADETTQVVARFERVKLIRKANGGPGSARNMGIRAAHGEYIALVDGDDLWLPGKLRLQMDLLARTGLAWVYCDGFIFDGQTGQNTWTFGRVKRLYQGDILEPLLLNNFIASPTPVIRRDVFEAAGYFDEAGPVHLPADWQQWLRIAARYPIGLVRRRLVRYRVHAGSFSVREDPLDAFDRQMRVIEWAVAREPARLGPLKQRAIANLRIGIGRSLARKGDLPAARQMFAAASRLAPTNVTAYVYWLGARAGGPLLRGGMSMRHWLRRLPPDTRP